MAGHKDIAFFSGVLACGYVMPEEFMNCLDDKHPLIGYKQAPDAYSHVFYRRGCEAKAEHFVALLVLARKHRRETLQYDAEIGRMLGYSEEDIADYLRHMAAKPR